MKVLVSACLMGQNCKYNGGNNYNEGLQKFLEGHEVVMVCPEVLGGLPTPRTPAEIVNGVVTNRDQVNVDQEFRLGARKAFEIAKQAEIDCAILQSRSPSCGIKEIYDGTFSKKKIKGHGVFAQMLIEAGIKVIDVEDID